MKKFPCYDCEAVFTATSRMDLLEQLFSHYMRMHKDILTKGSDAEQKVWMERFEEDWDAAPEV